MARAMRAAPPTLFDTLAVLCRAARLWRFCIHHGDQVFPGPEPICQASGHGGRHGQRLVDPEPVLERGIDRDHVGVVVELHREDIRQTRETTHLHPHRQIFPLGKARVGDRQACHRPRNSN